MYSVKGFGIVNKTETNVFLELSCFFDDPAELGMEQQTGSKLGKEYVNAVHCHPAYLTYMQSTL